LELFIVIPCYNEPDVLTSLNSLALCDTPNCLVTVLVVINSGVDTSPDVVSQNKLSLAAIHSWLPNKPPWLNLQVLHITDVPYKVAGVGNARKIGMDKAFDLAKNKEESVILCYDADCTCTSNYLSSIVQSFESHPNHDIATTYFEHPIGNNHAIVDYELFLRYHYQGLKYAEYPYAYQTIGSSMAVRGNTYKAFGGMNQRKAGEDFYFLHKIIPYRKVIEIKNCAVIPSARTSDRVPFGTGHAVAKYDSSRCKTYYTYHPAIYQEIRSLTKCISGCTLSDLSLDVSDEIRNFMVHEKFEEASSKIRQQSKSDALFQQNIFRWLNGFRMLKLVHHLRDTKHTNLPINEAVSQFWKLHYGQEEQLNNTAWLEKFRNLERQPIA
jgi:glycosyltransferase involved in cell wall biosynthesis